MWYIHAMEYYSASKKEENLTHAIIWLKLEGIMLSEINQTLKDYCMNPLTQIPRIVSSIETESRVMLNRDLGRGEWNPFMGPEFQFCKMKRSSGDG